MLKLNQVIITGRPTHDVELKQLPGHEKKVAEFQVAVDDSYYDVEQKKKIEKTQFISVRIYGPRGEALVKNRPKGKLFFFEGKITNDQWERQTTKEKRSRTWITASDWQFAEPPKNAASSPEAAEGQPTANEEGPF